MAWLVAGALAAGVAAGGAWWLQSTNVPRCGEGSVLALRAAIGELKTKLSGLEVDDDLQLGRCGLDGDSYGYWTYPSMGELLSDGAAAACKEGDLREQSQVILSCSTGHGVVELAFTSQSGVSVGGTLRFR